MTTIHKAVQSRLKTFNRWWKKNGDLKITSSYNQNYKKKKAQRSLILAAKRTTVAYACSDLEKQTVYFCEKRYNNSKWPKLRKTEAWTLFKLSNPTYSMRKRLLNDAAENYSKERQKWADELKELREMRSENNYNTHNYNKATVKKKPVISYRRTA
jgi:hypothetical protein